MALSNPTVLDAGSPGSGLTITSASFTPTAGALIVVPFSAFFSATTTVAISDTLGGLSWTFYGTNHSSATSRIVAGFYVAKAPASPVAGTVKLTFSVSASASTLRAFQVTGQHPTTPIGATGTAFATPTLTMSGAPAASSEVVGSITMRTGAAEGTTTAPSGFTAISMIGTTTTAQWEQSSYKNGSSATTLTWTEQTSASGSVVTAIEIVAATTASTLVVNDSVNSTNSDNLTLTQLHVLSVQNSVHSINSDNITLVQTHVLSVQNSVHGISSDQVTFSPNVYGYAARAYGSDRYTDTTYAPAMGFPDAIHFTSSDNVDLNQTPTLGMFDGQSGTNSDNLILTQTHLLFLSDSNDEGYIGNEFVGIDFVGSVISGDSGSVNSINSDFLNLTQTHSLSDADALNAVVSDPVALTQVHQLVVADSIHVMVSDVLFLSEEEDVLPIPTEQQVSSPSVGLTQTHNLVVQNALQTSTAGSVHLLLPTNLISQNGSNSIASPQVNLRQDQFLVVDSASHSLDSDNVITEFIYIMYVDDSEQLIISTDAILSRNMVVQDSSHDLTSINLMFVYGWPKIWVDGSWQRKPIKSYRDGSWVTVSLKQWDGDLETWQLV